MISFSTVANFATTELSDLLFYFLSRRKRGCSYLPEPSQNVGKSFIKSYAAVCLEGAIIVLGCIIYSLFAAAPPVVDPNAAAVTQVWSYVGELVFSMPVLIWAVNTAVLVVREMMGL